MKITKWPEIHQFHQAFPSKNFPMYVTSLHLTRHVFQFASDFSPIPHYNQPYKEWCWHANCWGVSGITQWSIGIANICQVSVFPFVCMSSSANLLYVQLEYIYKIILKPGTQQLQVNAQVIALSGKLVCVCAHAHAHMHVCMCIGVYTHLYFTV